ncbi:MAG: adenylate/guanylate cyclase domain-containing protein [Hyphomicrobiales bacterium]|nr:adenylate/guanylate cyclase domain-containing protein [Hyphomicrobiales bacterium]
MSDQQASALPANGPSKRKPDLPARVRLRIQEQERAAEILIGWVQLGVVVFFGLLYSLAPRAEGSAGFNFVPYGLGAYFIFTVLRLMIAHRAVAPPWFLVLSIVIDIALLVALIFSFHIQYNQHPAFYLKAPTLLYFFLFIVLRALRFDPRYVLVTGIAATLGWLGLAGYAVFADMDGMRITRNFVEYMTSDAILIGAELDKLLIFVAVTAVLTVALRRGRNLLIEAVREHSAAEELKRFFAPEIAATIAESDDAVQVGEGTSRTAAVLMIDIAGFTKIAARHDPQDVVRLLARFQNYVVPAIQKCNGRIDKFLGDGILATFGAVSPSNTYAADSLRAAAAIKSALTDCNRALADDGSSIRLQVRIGIACGEVIVGVVGVDDRLEFTVIGDAVNLAAKLEAANKVEATTALTTQTCLTAALGQGFVMETPLETRPTTTVAGFAHEVDLVVID